MVKRDALLATISEIIGHDLLAQAMIKDHRANGVQVTGSAEVTKLVLGVTVTMDFLQEAVKTDAQFCLAHHGLDLSEGSIVASRLHPGIQAQLEHVFKHHLTVAGYHYVLDAHPKLGNNAIILRELGAKRLDEPYLDGWGWVGEFSEPRDVKELAEQCSDLFDHDIFAVYAGPGKIRRLGVCSGGAKPYGPHLWEIMDKKIDLHITGEINEPSPELAKGIGYNYFAGGHYATEVFGVQELGKKIKDKYKDQLKVEFIDIPNPL